MITSTRFSYVKQGRIKHLLKVFLFLIILFTGCKKDTSTIEDEETQFSSNDIIEKICPSLTVSLSEYGINDSLKVKLSKPIDSIQIVIDNKLNRRFKTVIEKITINNLDLNESLTDPKYSVIDPATNQLQIELSTLRKPNYSYSFSIHFLFFELINEKWEPLLYNEIVCQKKVERLFKTAKLSSNILECNLAKFKLIKDVTFPNNTFAQVLLNYTTDSILFLTRDTHSYFKARAKIKKMELLKDQVIINSVKNWESANKCTLEPETILNNSEEYQVSVLVDFEEETPNGWIPLKDASGKLITEDHTYGFTTNASTGNGIDQYIRATYPLTRQFNFYAGEYPKGYYLFYYNPTIIPQIGNQTVRFKFIQLPSGDEIATCDGDIDVATKTIWFDIPSNLIKEKPYRLQMIVNSTVVHQLEFRVSKYNSIAEKLPESRNVLFLYSSDVGEFEGKAQIPDLIGCTIYPNGKDECFDYYEIKGLNSEPLIKRKPILSKYDWFNASIYKQMYDAISEGSDIKLTRDLSGNGILPTGDQYIWQIDFDRKLSDDEINTGSFTYDADFYHIVNYLPKIWASDYLDVRSQLLKKYTSTNLPPNEVYKYIYNNALFPVPQNGNYPILIQYKLPGKDIITTEKEINITMDLYK